MFRIVLIVIAVGLFAGGGLLLWASSFTIPDLQSFDNRQVIQTTKVYDRTGEHLLFELNSDIRRTVVPSSDISRHIKNATIAIEDAEFFEHRGIKPSAILRATLVNFFALDFEQGGSTITQQVVKNTLLTNEKTIPRKLKEWVLAVRLEQRLSKDEILNIYLNEAPYGGSIYGVEEASQAFFNKPASEVTLAEAAYLAALPKAPTYYSPHGNHQEELENRKEVILSRMHDLGFISESEYETAKTAEVTFEPRNAEGIQAPHFVMYVREKLEERYGRRAVAEEGFRVTTTLDYEMQQIAQETVQRYALENEEKFNAENAGLVAIDPQTGQIRAMVGSRDYFDDAIDGNVNIALAERQPGSAFKPFAYAAALERGYTPETVVFDAATQFSTACAPNDLTSDDGCYAPSNYDDTFRGPVTLREALAQSINVPAIKTLYLAGMENTLQLAHDMGISTLTDVNQYGLTLVLGGGEVTLLDMTSAYGTFANEGVRHAHTPIMKVEDNDGNVVDRFTKQPHRELDTRVARQITDILSDNAARTPAFGANSPLHFPGRDVAAKTGTTNDYRDAWILGYTPNLAVGTWAGNNDNTSMEKRVAGFVVAPMWHAFLEEVFKTLPEESFTEPRPEENAEELKPILRGIWKGNETYTIDTISGDLATEHTPEKYREERAVPNVHSILHWVDRTDPRGPVPEDPTTDGQYRYWEYGVEQWTNVNGFPGSENEKPTEYDAIHTPERAPHIRIENRSTLQTIDLNKRVTIPITQTSGDFSLTRAEYYINDVLIGSAQRTPLSLSFIPADVGISPGTHTLSITAYDSVGNTGAVSHTIVVE